MPKSFDQSFQEWVQDNRYGIGDDVGWEYADSKEAGPTPADRSLTPDNGTTHPTEEVLGSGEAS